MQKEEIRISSYSMVFRNYKSANSRGIIVGTKENIKRVT